MLLAFDVGNTNIVLGVFRDGELVQNWRMETMQSRSADEYGMMVNQLFEFEELKLDDISDVIVSTVVPSVLFTLQHMSQKYLGKRAMVVGPGIKTGLKIVYDDPTQVGADRIVNAVAALSKYGGPLVVIDFGTATTFCACTKDWRYVGGAIAPGIKMSAEGMVNSAAKLPRVELMKPEGVISRTTVTNMQSGLFYGFVGSVDYTVRRMKEELGALSAAVVATGGLARLLAPELKVIDHMDGLLTLKGLRIIYENEGYVN